MAEQPQVSDRELCCWAYEGQVARVRAALHGSPQLAQDRDSHQRTPLHWACSSGQLEIAQILLDVGAEVRRLLRSSRGTYFNRYGIS